MFVFQKIWRALLSRNIRFEIRPFALLPTNYRARFMTRNKSKCWSINNLGRKNIAENIKMAYMIDFNDIFLPSYFLANSEVWYAYIISKKQSFLKSTTWDCEYLKYIWITPEIQKLTCHFFYGAKCLGDTPGWPAIFNSLNLRNC